MANNVSEELFNAIVKATSSRKKGNYEDKGIWVDWDLNNGVLKGNFAIPIQKVINSEDSSFVITAEDFLNYDGDE